MRIRLIRSDLNAPPGTESTGLIKGPRGILTWKLGAILDVPKRACELLVGNGDAEPVCEEAKILCEKYAARRDEILLSREMLANAIEPEDRERFRNGEILGYDENGNDIPGPNWVELEDDDTEEDDE